ncbi:hypothetical protein TNCV_511671 [Trichonephila clavipes]|nr:hypothetical protein TNCV_511671 [Trichonephila clavipes]
MPSSDIGTATAGAGATSPSRLSFDDSFIVEHSNLFRETIIARNVYAAWARKLTTAKPNDPDLQNIHMEVAKSGEIVSSHLAKLDVPLFKIPASEKELDRIILREKNKAIVLPKKQEEKKPAVAPPPPSSSPRKGRKGAKRTVDSDNSFCILVLVVIEFRRVPSSFERSPRVQSGSFSIRFFDYSVSHFGLVPSNITDRGYCQE